MMKICLRGPKSAPTRSLFVIVYFKRPKPDSLCSSLWVDNDVNPNSMRGILLILEMRQDLSIYILSNVYRDITQPLGYSSL